MLFFVQNHALHISFYVLNAKITFSSTENKWSKPAFSKEIIAIKTTRKVITNHQAIFFTITWCKFFIISAFYNKKKTFSLLKPRNAIKGNSFFLHQQIKVSQNSNFIMKISNLFVCLLLALTTFTSCSKDDEEEYEPMRASAILNSLFIEVMHR